MLKASIKGCQSHQPQVPRKGISGTSCGPDRGASNNLFWFCFRFRKIALRGDTRTRDQTGLLEPACESCVKSKTPWPSLSLSGRMSLPLKFPPKSQDTGKQPGNSQSTRHSFNFETLTPPRIQKQLGVLYGVRLNPEKIPCVCILF